MSRDHDIISLSNDRYDGLVIFPKKVTNSAVITYFAAMMGCIAIFSTHIMDIQWWIFGLVEVLGFFYFANRQSKVWITMGPISFAKKLFWTALALRLVWVLLSYLLYMRWTETPFAIDAADELFYDEVAHYGASLIREGKWRIYDPIVEYSGDIQFSDMGYPMYLSLLYWIFDDSILMARIIKAALSAWTAVLIYKVAARNFGEYTGRVAGIMCMLMPNLMYYCSMQLKEVEMVFLAMLFIERADYLLRQGRLKFLPIAALMLIPLFLFMIRTALAATLVAAFLCALLLTSGRVMGWGKRIVIGVVAGAFFIIMLFSTTSIGQDVREMWASGGSDQQANMEWRTQRDNGNIYAKYAGAAVFAPMIFTIPFPTMTDTPKQENQKMIHGGNFVKNIMSFFTIMSMVVLLFSGGWRRHVLLVATLCGYLVVLAFSSFAHSERFHQPILPLIMMFAAYGITLVRDNPWIKKYFPWWCFVMFIAAMAWNWFKLAGRGMI